MSLANGCAIYPPDVAVPRISGFSDSAPAIDKEFLVPCTDNRLKFKTFVLEGRDPVCSRLWPKGRKLRSSSTHGEDLPSRNPSVMHDIRLAARVRAFSSDPSYNENGWSRSSQEYGYRHSVGRSIRGHGLRITDWDISDTHPFRIRPVRSDYKNMKTTYMDLGSTRSVEHPSPFSYLRNETW